MARLGAEEQAEWQKLEAEWKSGILPIYERIDAANSAANQLFPEWQLDLWNNWSAPEEFKNAARFGRLEVEVAALAEVAVVGQASRLAAAGVSPSKTKAPKPTAGATPGLADAP